MTSITLPIVDIAAAASAPPAQRRDVALSLTEACKDVGFVYITGHGIDGSVLASMFELSRRLFALSMDEKKLAPHPPGGAVHRGYSYPGQEKVSQATSDDADGTLVRDLRQVVDCKESYEIGSDLDDEQPNVWLPENVLPGFREQTTDFYDRCFRVGQELMRLLALGLGLPEDYLLQFHSGHYNQLRLLHYPPVQAEALELGQAERMPAHTDWGTITLLFQDDCGGLEVEDPRRPGAFIPATPVENSLVMNVGDILMRWSNDILTSTHHRVGLPPLADRVVGPARMTRARYSIPYFIGPDPLTMVECLSVCAARDNERRYEPIMWRDYRLMRGSTQY